MDLARTLIRIVARAFYETRHILVIDALFIHSVLHAEDLAHLLGMQQKDLRKLCGRLREDRLLAVHSRPEIREGQTRPVNREYYYIPLHPVIDAIKYRVSRLTSTIKTQYTPSVERKEFFCPRCKSEWTQLEVLSHVGPEGFECQKCGEVLLPSDEVEGGAGADRSGHEKNSRLMAQLDPILKLLKQIDSVEIPPNDFETAWDHKVDVVRNKYTNPTKPGVVVNKQPAVRGISKTDASTLEVSLTSSAEKTAEEQAREAARKAALEKQNALPIWHTQSTVKPDAGNLQPAKVEPAVKEKVPAVDIKPEIKEEQRPDTEDLDDKVAAYYAEMEREKEREAREEEEEEEEESSDEEDEDEDEFEDVGVTPNGSGTPQIDTAIKSPAMTNGSFKRELETDSGSSAPQTNVGTPITPADEGPAAKKVKIEDNIKKEEDSDEEDEEFEDV
ncbi:hypothetical protein VTO42DRAFT_9031 [Malbranchea cinnamomea]